MPQPRPQASGFKDWYDFTRRNLDAPLGLLDEQLSDAEFVARDEFQMGVLAATGPGPVARELLDRANPTGAWSKKPANAEAWPSPALAD
jgi:hypothetical protein